MQAFSGREKKQMKNFNISTANLTSRVKSAVEAQNLAYAKILVKGQSWNSFTHYFSNKLSLRKISNKNFVVIASIALTLAFVPLLYELNQTSMNTNLAGKSRFDVNVQVDGFTETVKICMSPKGALLIHTFDDGNSFITDLSTEQAANIPTMLLTKIGILLWEGNVSASPNFKVVFSNSSSGVIIEQVKKA
ncbi:MAG: hypothetical protein WC325_10425 [Candidatus Bathyarchaeia archaeon]|jgi:hypothetical protein